MVTQWKQGEPGVRKGQFKAVHAAGCQENIMMEYTILSLNLRASRWFDMWNNIFSKVYIKKSAQQEPLR